MSKILKYYFVPALNHKLVLFKVCFICFKFKRLSYVMTQTTQ